MLEAGEAKSGISLINAQPQPRWQTGQLPSCGLPLRDWCRPAAGQVIERAGADSAVGHEHEDQVV
jgi:hypothetical protein